MKFKKALLSSDGSAFLWYSSVPIYYHLSEPAPGITPSPGGIKTVGTVSLDGQSYAVASIAKNAFKGSGVKKLS